MANPLNKKEKSLFGFGNTGNKKLRPGGYVAEIVSVEEKPGYVKGQAYILTYKLTDSAGNTYTKTETFINDFKNPRTKEFIDYLENAGYVIDNVEDLVGIKENVILEYEVVYGSTYLNITRREVATEKEGAEA